MNVAVIIYGLWLVSVGVVTEFAPTKVAVPQIKTIPPSDGGNKKYVETVYKETNHRTMVHTIEPLQPSYEVKYQSTSLTTVNNQTITTTTAEFATVLNETVLYDTEALANYTYNGAATYYQTLEFATQRVEYTPVSEHSLTEAVTVTESNALPFV